MIRSIGFALALFTGSVVAGELGDCFNDDVDTGTRYTRSETKSLRVTDADIAAMLDRIREHENRVVARFEPESTVLVRNDRARRAPD